MVTSKSITSKMGLFEKMTQFEIDHSRNWSLRKITTFEIGHFENDTLQNRSLGKTSLKQMPTHKSITSMKRPLRKIWHLGKQLKSKNDLIKNGSFWKLPTSKNGYFEKRHFEIDQLKMAYFGKEINPEYKLILKWLISTNNSRRNQSMQKRSLLKIAGFGKQRSQFEKKSSRK